MLNYIWAFMILVGIVYAAFTGNMAAVTDAALSSAGEAVSLCITMAGVMALWMGLMKIAEKSGLIARLTTGIQPLLSFLFPDIPKKHEARQYIATNFIANILGLGWACTPAGLKAMEALAKLEEERGMPGFGNRSSSAGYAGERSTASGLETGCSGERVASREMCTFLILNTSSLQLIPVNMIVYRTQYGSARPRYCTGYSGYPCQYRSGDCVLPVFRQTAEKEITMANVFANFSGIIIPVVIFYIVAQGIFSKIKVYEEFIEGAKDGLKTVVQILPTLVGLMAGVGVLRASGFMGALGRLLGGVTEHIGIPADIVPLVLVKMFSSSAATGLVLDIFKTHGTDSYIGMLTSILMSCTETIFYTMSVYFLAAKVTKTRYTLAGALFSSFVGLIASVILTGWIC